MTVIGLDLSLTATGISDGTITWAVKSAGKKGDDLAARRERLVDLRSRIVGTLPAGTDLVVIEAPAFASQMGHMHDRSGLWWLVVSRLQHLDVPVAEVAPAALKKYATGKGNANKGAMIEAATRRFPNVETNGDDNRVDALFLALMGIDQTTGTPQVPQLHRSALEAVRWPLLVSA